MKLEGGKGCMVVITLQKPNQVSSWECLFFSFKVLSPPNSFDNLLSSYSTQP